jgi:flagellar biosynthesis/type III secretory pathway protein FliH
LKRQAREGAAALIAQAEKEAEGIVKRAKQQARTLGDSQLKLWQEAFDTRQAELSDSLGQAVTLVVSSVLKSLIGSVEDLPVKTSIELAMRALNAELRAAAVCHPMDLPLVQAHAARLGATTVAEDADIPRGQILFSSDEGDVRVDGQRVLDRLLVDLKQVLSSKPQSAAS